MRARSFLYSVWHTELIFHAAFLYALAWRYVFPDIDASSEKITDLTFIANYLGGDTLPPVDRWLPPFRFEMYYALQHYAAALLGRIFGTTPGMAYNLGLADTRPAPKPSNNTLARRANGDKPAPLGL